MIKDLEPEAYGVLGLSPDEFGRLTLGEYMAKIKGHYIKETRLAWHIGQFSGMNDPEKYPSLQSVLDSLEGGE